jgi:hypothetical protein
LDVSWSQFEKPPLQAAIWHVPVAQDSDPFGSSQCEAQPPQSVSVFSAASQPSPYPPLQLPYPPLQLMEHDPALHEAAPWMLAHMVPHEPQLDVLVWVLASQPLAAIPSQFWKVPVHAPIWQTPGATHEGAALGKLQVLPHVPQLRTSFVLSTSQPSPGLLLQSR